MVKAMAATRGSTKTIPIMKVRYLNEEDFKDDLNEGSGK